MDKIVTSGESNCYVTLTESNECAVKFDRTYRMFAVNNTSENEAIMSLSPNKSRTDDGVRIIPAGESRTLTTSGIDSDTVYINGNGSVEVAALNGNSVNPFFKGSSGGGGGGSSYIPNSEKGAAGGVATLDISGKVPAAQLPSYVDDVIDGYYYESSFYADSEHTQLIVGETGKIYNDVSTNISYRWNGTGYTAMSVQNAVTYTSQALTTEQKTQARENIGAAASDDIPTDAVKYTAQTLTNAQKTQARTNIGAGTSSFSGNYSDLTNPPPLLKGNGSGGNLVGGTGVNSNTTRYTNSVAYGNITEAAANYAFAFGEYAFAGEYNHNTGKHAVAIGKNVRAKKDYEWAIGKFNQTNSDTAFAYGDGTGDSDRHNLMELKTNGSLLLNGNAVQTKNLATPLSISGTSQNTVESALGAISKKTSLLADINRNLGAEITAAQKLAIATGTFEDLPIGAYWTLNNTVYRIAHHDYYLGTGDTACTSHHIVVVPDNAMYSAKMNDTNTTTGGYANSKMRTTNLATALSTFETDFGVAHILNHRILITNAVSDGQASGGTWVDSKVDLMSENMVFGHPVWGKTGHETGVERGQLALFSLYPEYIQKQRLWYWLRSVDSGSNFCLVDYYGDASYGSASGSGGVRPYACIYFDDVL